MKKTIYFMFAAIAGLLILPLLNQQEKCGCCGEIGHECPRKYFYEPKRIRQNDTVWESDTQFKVFDMYRWYAADGDSISNILLSNEESPEDSLWMCL
jgi:hypothetical protein